MLQPVANVVMAYPLPVDAVPGLDTGLWLGMFVVLQIVLHGVGVMRVIFAA